MVLNRIEQREREAAEQRRNTELKQQQKELERQQAENQRRHEQMQQQIEDQRLAEARRQLVRTNSNYVFSSSGVLQGLKHIERGKLAGIIKKHALVIDLDTGTAQLVWGNKFTVENNQVSNARRFFSGLEEADYQSINVTVDPDSFDLSIQGAGRFTLTQNEWENNPDRVLDALADAYLNPDRVTHREEPPSSSGSSYSSYSSGIDC